MGKKLRFTGEWPPFALLAKYPNWEFALDEEGEEGQDETTIRPAANQTVIDDITAFTAGTAVLADGRSFPAILEVPHQLRLGFHDYILWPRVDVFINKKNIWRLEYSPDAESWEPRDETWLPESERIPLNMEDPTVFPLVVTSNLTVQGPGQPLCFRILNGGRKGDT